MESPQSVTVQYYYKGFSILLTKREADIEVKQLLQSAMDSIDWAILQGLKPSWNQQTNQELEPQLKIKPVIHTETEKKPMPVEEFEKTCENCGAKKILSKKGNMVCSKFCWVKK